MNSGFSVIGNYNCPQTSGHSANRPDFDISPCKPYNVQVEMKVKNWMLGLLQALLVFLLTLLLGLLFQYVLPLNNGLFYRESVKLNLLLTGSMWLLYAVSIVMLYALSVLYVPIRLFIKGKGLDGLKVFGFTLLFLVLLLTVMETVILLKHRTLPDRDGKHPNQSYQNYYITPEEAIRKSEQAKKDNDYLINQYLEEKKPDVLLKEIDLKTEYGVAPYSTDINTGERIYKNE